MREGLHKVVSADDTIVAVATPVGRSALGIVRMSGDDALRITGELFETKLPLEHRKACVGRWRDARQNLIDEVVVTAFRSPHSYTGEQLVEISAHGNPLVLNHILRSILSAGARLAQPGEFTLRAVHHGKMDLIQAEAVRDFIDAQTEGQARTALRQMEGALSRRIQPLKERLIDIIAQLEAGIDFVEDELDIPNAEIHAASAEEIVGGLVALQKTFGFGRLLIQGLRLVIVGKPNVGKSSLFNCLVASDRAIVTDIPGTTRDLLSETVSVDGVPIRIFDTAGIHSTEDYVESLGMGRSVDALTDADLALVVVDGSNHLDDEDRRVLKLSERLPSLIIINKSDLGACLGVHSFEGGDGVVRVSARTGDGLGDLDAAIRHFLSERRGDDDSDVVLTNLRQNDAVDRAIHSLQAGVRAILAETPHEMVLLDFYDALSALNELTGEVVTDDILDRIFTTFCVGK